MNQKVNTWLAIALIAVLAGAVAFFALSNSSSKATTQTQIQIPKAAQKPQTSEKGSKETGCLNSGGTISAASCCGQTQDFPNSCLIGACGCAPASSHQVKSCNCGAGKCFDGNSCVGVGSQTNNQQNQTGLVYKNTDYGFQLTLPKGWGTYKTSVDKSGENINIFFYLPTTDKLYPNPSKDLKGYADIFSIIVFTSSEWNKQLNSTKCKVAGGSVGCFYPQDIIGKNNSYIFSYSFANGVPDDLKNIQQQMIDSDYLKKNFKLL